MTTIDSKEKLQRLYRKATLKLALTKRIPEHEASLRFWSSIEKVDGVDRVKIPEESILDWLEDNDVAEFLSYCDGAKQC